LDRNEDLGGESRVSVAIEFLDEKEVEMERTEERRKGRLLQLQQLIQLRSEANQVKS